VTEGEYVVDHWSITGTNTGPLHSPSGSVIPPSGKSVSLQGVLTSRVRNGKVLASWGYFDLAALLMQIGVVPAM
jgi:predicted ester cyclase